jgi:hypothetical protein
MQSLRQPKVKALVALTLFFALAGIALTVYLAVRSDEPDDPFRGDAITDAPFASLTYGVHTFLWWDSNMAGLHMDWVDLMSFTHVRQTYAWQDVEPEQGEWRFDNGDRILDGLEARGLQLVMRLSDIPDWAHPGLPPKAGAGYIDAPPDAAYMDAWATYCGTVAGRYTGRVAAYQIWNEPNLAREWGNNPPDAAAFVAMLAACSDAIRAADPDAVIISPGLSPTGNNDAIAIPDDVFLQQMYDADFAPYVDVVGAHAPGFSAPTMSPDDAEAEGRGRWATFRRIEDLRRVMVRNGDAATQMAILETGYTIDPRPDSDYHWFAVDVDTQAQYMVEAYTYAAENWRPWVGLMTVIYIPNPDWTMEDEQYWWSITDPEMASIRPAFALLARMPKYCGDVVIPERTPEEAGLALESNPCH